MISFCPKSNGLLPTDSTFLASSQLTMSIHWPCYCTVHDYVVIHSCNSMWSLWVEANLCSFFIVCLSVLSLEIKLLEGWGIPLPPLTCQMIVPFQFRNRISNAMFYGIFYVDHHCFKLSLFVWFQFILRHISLKLPIMIYYDSNNLQERASNQITIIYVPSCCYYYWLDEE